MSYRYFNVIHSKITQYEIQDGSKLDNSKNTIH